MQNLLVTGGCGFIGSNFIRYLLKESSFSGRIINVDKLTYAGNPENLQDIVKKFGKSKKLKKKSDSDDIESNDIESNDIESNDIESNDIDKIELSCRYFFEKSDICNITEMERIFKAYEIDSVCHFAAESHVDRSIVSPEIFIDTNIKGTFNLLECAKKSKYMFKLFHHVSTDEVYGTLGKSGYFTENTPYSPNSPYSASKASSDHLVRAYHHTYGLPVTISNCSNNYGPFQFPEKLIPLMILNAIEGKELPIYGDGKNIRDWLYVRDHCVAIWLIMQKGKIGRTYNIGGECEMDNRTVVEKICNILDELRSLILDELPGLILDELPSLDKSQQLKFSLKSNGVLSSSKELIRFVKDRLGHDFRYAIDCTRLKQELGWHPEESFDTGIKKTVQWYFNNMQWVEKIKSGDYLD